MSNYPFIQSLLDKHKMALASNSKDVRLTMTDLNNLVHDIHALMASVEVKHDSNDELKSLLKTLLIEIKELNNSESDGGIF